MEIDETKMALADKVELVCDGMFCIGEGLFCIGKGLLIGTGAVVVCGVICAFLKEAKTVKVR